MKTFPFTDNMCNYSKANLDYPFKIFYPYMRQSLHNIIGCYFFVLIRSSASRTHVWFEFVFMSSALAHQLLGWHDTIHFNMNTVLPCCEACSTIQCIFHPPDLVLNDRTYGLQVVFLQNSEQAKHYLWATLKMMC